VKRENREERKTCKYKKFASPASLRHWRESWPGDPAALGALRRETREGTAILASQAACEDV